MERELALRIAKALQDEWEIGTTSRFCDEPPDFDRATDDEIANLLEGFSELPTDAELQPKLNSAQLKYVDARLAFITSFTEKNMSALFTAAPLAKVGERY